jgi:hypothetical protein
MVPRRVRGIEYGRAPGIAPGIARGSTRGSTGGSHALETDSIPNLPNYLALRPGILILSLEQGIVNPS